MGIAIPQSEWAGDLAIHGHVVRANTGEDTRASNAATETSFELRLIPAYCTEISVAADVRKITQKSDEQTRRLLLGPGSAWLKACPGHIQETCVVPTGLSSLLASFPRTYVLG